MASSSLKAFMRKRSEEVVSVKGPETIVDSEGNPVILKVKRLSMTKINDIYDRYHYEINVKDEKGNLQVRNNRVVKDFFSDEKKYNDRLIVEALVEPNLHDEELMKFYGVHDVMDMPDAMFSAKEYFYILDIINKLSGTFDGENIDELIDEAKN